MSRILVVEDDEVLRNELIELLRNEGYEAEYISTFLDTAGQILCFWILTFQSLMESLY